MTPDEPAMDAVFAALADWQRRVLLTYLQDAGEAPIEELTAVIDEQTGGQRGSERGWDPVVRLRHVHLPKLADAGLVEYDRTSGQVEYVGCSAITELLATAPDGPHPG